MLEIEGAVPSFQLPAVMVWSAALTAGISGLNVLVLFAGREVRDFVGEKTWERRFAEQAEEESAAA